jgi:hypothetical protein
VSFLQLRVDRLFLLLRFDLEYSGLRLNGLRGKFGETLKAGERGIEIFQTPLP